MLAFELIHEMKSNGKRKKVEVAMKIDISTAYDRMRWEFLEAILVKVLTEHGLNW